MLFLTFLPQTLPFSLLFSVTFGGSMLQITNIIKQIPLLSETHGKKIEPIDWAIALSLLLLAAFLYIPMLGNFHFFDVTA
jgi:hypothetical protein